MWFGRLHYIIWFYEPFLFCVALIMIIYPSKKEVAQKMGYHLIEPIWKQILMYRSNWMEQVDDVEVCLCPGILKKMLQLNEFLFQMNYVELNPFETRVESETGKWMMSLILKTEGVFESRLHQLCLLYQMNENELYKVHQKCSSALIFVLWSLMKYGGSEFGCLLVLLKLKTSGMTSLLNLMEASDLSVDWNDDMTYILDHLLNCWIKRGQKRILMNNHDELCDLMYQYPQLKKHQIEFYLNHHTPGYYYTIEQFIQYCDVCYETGRSALQQLVSLGFYQKIKQGKKFVYTAR